MNGILRQANYLRLSSNLWDEKVIESVHVDVHVDGLCVEDVEEREPGNREIEAEESPLFLRQAHGSSS